jgi:hypothetical protein
MKAPDGSGSGTKGLASYSASQTEMARRTAVIIDKILKGSKPADLPTEQPTKFALVINLKQFEENPISVPWSPVPRVLLGFPGSGHRVFPHRLSGQSPIAPHM